MKGTIFMIHGMWGGVWCWDNYRRFFQAKGYHCIAPLLRYHYPYHGDICHPFLGTTSLLDYAEDLEKEIRNLGESPIIMGHSMGGLLAQILGSRGLGKSLVLVAPASPAGILALKSSVIKSFWGIVSTWGYWNTPVRLPFETAVYAALHKLPEKGQREIYDQFVCESGRVVFELGMWPFDSRKASSVDEAKITCPVLVLSGAEDRVTPASVVRQVADKYQRVSTYREFPHHAHWLIGEPGWEEIAENIDEWLEKTEK